MGGHVYFNTRSAEETVDRFVRDILSPTLRENMKTFKENPETETFWTSIQTSFECCGLNNSTDWEEAIQEKKPSSCRDRFRAQGCGEKFSQLRVCWSWSDDKCQMRFLWVRGLYSLHIPVMLLSLVLASIVFFSRSSDRRVDHIEAAQDFQHIDFIDTSPAYSSYCDLPPSYDQAMLGRK